jgi:hypothetical protein
VANKSNVDNPGAVLLASSAKQGQIAAAAQGRRKIAVKKNREEPQKLLHLYSKSKWYLLVLNEHLLGQIQQEMLLLPSERN